MRILSLILIGALLLLFKQQRTHPHGKEFRISCDVCHSPKSWTLDKEVYSFDHGKTKMALLGQHMMLNCRQCHNSLVFKEVKTECNECHTDIHQASVGPDCSRCHTPTSWLVSNITEIHQLSRFPLLGAHRTADCDMCHISETSVRFDVLGVDCIDCHEQDYLSTTSPNHQSAGFSEDCSSCHPINSMEWTGAGFNHNFFPLELGHSGLECSVCHTTGNYTDASSECYSCHQQDYLGTVNPNHQTIGFPTTCETCHTLQPGWSPASFTQHDSQWFPIYSGSHNGTWSSCTECHPNPASYAQYTCLSCHAHNQASMDDEHNEVGGYSYSSPACLNCHPRGVAEDK